MADQSAIVENSPVTFDFKLSTGGEDFKASFGRALTVADVKLNLSVHPYAQHFTNYALVYQGQTLPDEVQLSELVGENQTKATITMKQLPYNEKTIREHISKVRDIVGFTVEDQSSFGINSGVSNFNDLALAPISSEPRTQVRGENGEEKLPQRSTEERDTVKEIIASFMDTFAPSNFVSTPPIAPAVKSLYISSQEVPLTYLSKGHLLYIVAQSLEGETYHITGSVSGFYLNKTTQSKFDPSPRETHEKHYTLFELFKKCSKNFLPSYKNNVQKMQALDSATLAHAQTAFLSSPWITKTVNSIPDPGRNQFADDHTHRDFINEYQSIKELSTHGIQNRILRERLLAKTAYEFTVEATKGALSVLNGGTPAINPDDESLNQIFLKNGIFYSFGVDSSGQFAERGGDAASRACANQDLNAIRFVNAIGSKGVYTLLTTIVDFAGKRVICQTPVPGLFTNSEAVEEKNEETGEVEVKDGPPLTSIAYGYDEGSGAVLADKEFASALEDVRKAVHLKKQTLENGDELVTNKEIKGMRGTDGRKYFLELYNLTPLDVTFIEKHFNPTSDESYPHKQAVIRLEALQEWWASKVRDLIKQEAESKGIDLSAPRKDGEEPPEVTVDDEKIALPVEGIDDNVRDLSAFISKTLIPAFIDQYKEQGTIAPIEGAHLTSQLHKFGINMRYLGEVASQLEKRISETLDSEKKFIDECPQHNKEFNTKLEERNKLLNEEFNKRAEAEAKGEKPSEIDIPELDTETIEAPLIAHSKQLQHIYNTTIQEMIARAAKHILRSYASALPISVLPSLVSHFHNALLGSSFNAEPVVSVEDAELYDDLDLSFTKLTPESVRDAIEKDIKRCYRFDLPADWVATISPVQLQREIAVKFGIQWQLREYFFTKESYEEHLSTLAKEKKSKKNKTAVTAKRTNVFDSSDVSFVPLIKHVIPRATTAEQIFEAGRQSLLSEKEEEKAEGQQLITESLSIYEQIYGEIHPEVQRVYSSLSQLYQEAGSKVESTYAARKAAIIAERLYGVDAHETVVALLNLAYLELEAGSLENSLKVYSRVSQIWSTVYSNNHVSVVPLLSSVIVAAQEEGYFREAIPLVNRLIAASVAVHGADSCATAYLKFRLAFLYALCERFSECLTQVTESYETFAACASEKSHYTVQARELMTKIKQWKQFQEAKARAEKEVAKLNASKKEAEKKTKNGKKKATPNLETNSIDEVLDWIAPSKGKSKSKKGKN